jgi:serine/threonine protein kinase
MTVSSNVQLGRFKLECEIGKGSFSSVWRAHDGNLGRDVAVKIPRFELDHETKQSFLKEARLVAQLNHEGIVRVLEAHVDEASSTPYMVLELIDGVTLREWCCFVDLSVLDKAKIAANIAWAVHHAHCAGIIHRDLKPANILMSLNGKLQVADFGLALTAGIDTPTKISTIGSIAYMSPEQANLLPAPVTASSDVYSIGVILFEMLSGANPIDAISPSEHLAKLANADRKSLKILQPDVPRDLVVICEKSLEQLPQDRFTSAKELAEELERFLIGVPIASRRLSMIESLGRTTKRNPRMTGLTLLVTLFVAASVVAGYYFQQRLAREWIARREMAVSNLLSCESGSVSSAIHDLSPFFQELADEFEKRIESETPEPRLRLLMALAAMGRTNIDQLIKAIPECPPDEATNLVNALSHDRAASIQALRDKYRAEVKPAIRDTDLSRVARFAIILAHVGGRDGVNLDGVKQLTELDADPTDRTQLLQEWPEFHGKLKDLLVWSQKELPSSLLSSIVEVLGKWKHTTPDENDEINQIIKHIYETNGSSAVHSTAAWALRRRGSEVPEEPQHQIEGQGWFELDNGLTMVRLSQVTDDPSVSTLSISATEITNKQFWIFCPEHAKTLLEKFDGPHSENDAVRFIDAKSMFLYCNFLSKENSLKPCYSIPEKPCYSIPDDSDPDLQVSVDFGANGFRLPTMDEWKIANLAGSRLRYFYGDNGDQLSLFANKSGKPATTPTMMFPPNAWGLFDTLGNVAEACHPNRDSGIVKYVNFQGDSMMIRTGDHPGGLSNELILDEESGFRSKSIHGFRVVCNR